MASLSFKTWYLSTCEHASSMLTLVFKLASTGANYWLKLKFLLETNSKFNLK